MEKRYEKNMTALSQSACESLGGKRVCVAGCGGLGGYVVEMLARTGVGSITAVDYDAFSESNLNRQLFSTESNLGIPKVLAARERIRAVNSAVALHAVEKPLNRETAPQILPGHHVVVDALDNVPARLLLAEYCRELSIPLVHGAIGGWYGQVTTILPGDDTLRLIYQRESGEGAESELGNLAFTAAATAAVQCGEVIKLLTGKGEVLSKQLLRLDLLDNDYTILDLA